MVGFWVNHQQGVGECKIRSVYIYGTGNCIINYMCVCALWRKGALLIKTPSLCSKHITSSPLSAKTNARSMQLCRIYDNNRLEKIKAMHLVAAAVVAALA